MTDFAAIDAFIRANIPKSISELRELCGVPSVSSRHQSIEECASLVASMLRQRGFVVEVLPTDGGHPVVLGHVTGANPSRRLLFYNHYDVQPPEPLDLWNSPPFDLVERDGAVFARGSKDDKGEFVCRLAALDAVRAVTGFYPCDMVWLAEGEEEIGSPHLPSWIADHWDRLEADAAIWEEGGTEVDETPVVRLGARGLLYVELSVRSIPRDAHSGQANLLPNAAWRLVWALASIKGLDERVLIPGFYDDVRPPSPRQEELLLALPSNAADIRTEFDLAELLGGTREVDRAYFSPTCNIAGLVAGHQGEGTKTVIPAQALAKLDFRLVPDQKPNDIVAKLRTHLDVSGFKDVQIETLGAEPPGVTDADASIVKLTAEIGLEIYGKPARITPFTGGTTPMYLFTERGIPVVAPGVGWGTKNRAHSPNEFMRLKDFERAARHIARLAIRFAET